MKMHGRIPHTALVQWIRSVFQKGVILTVDVSHYMESTFGTQDIETVLENAPDCETGPLLELLCFPDREMQIRFESRWGGYPFTADDQDAIIAQLCRTPLSTVITSTSSDPLCPIDIPSYILDVVVQRLRITRQPPLQLTQAIDRHYPAERRPAIRVPLRNARLPWHEGQIRLMELFLSKMSAETDGFEACLAFLISIMSELMPGCGIRDFLVAKKLFYFKALCRAENYERRRRSSNMEIMMLQGARAAHGDAEVWRHGMRMIDMICRALFGETRFFQRPGQDCLNVEHGAGQRQIQDVIRLLAGNSN